MKTKKKTENKHPTAATMLHKQGLCNKLTGWGEKGDWWLNDRRVNRRVVSPVDRQWHEKTRDPYKIYGDWVGGIRRISTLLPSLRSVLSPYLSLSLLNIPEAWCVYSIKLPLDNWCVLKATATTPLTGGGLTYMGLSHVHATHNVVNQHIYTLTKSIYKQ